MTTFEIFLILGFVTLILLTWLPLAIFMAKSNFKKRQEMLKFEDFDSLFKKIKGECQHDNTC